MNDMNSTPKGNRIHIGFFGKCNAGKSTLINMLTGQEVSLVAQVAGTTTDPVSKAMEILPLGPVVITDTAGIDDTSELGLLRIGKTKSILPKMNIGVYVLRSDQALTEDDRQWIDTLASYKLPIALFINVIKGSDIEAYMASIKDLESKVNVLVCSDFSNSLDRLKLLDLLGGLKPLDMEENISLLEGVVSPGDMVVLVCPIDSAAPKGRMILPQVQMIREILDRHALCMVVQTDELKSCLNSLKEAPKIVITDSQAFETVNSLVPKSIPLTSFSILMARYKGRLKDLVAGIKALDNLHKGSKVLISEGCTHRRQCDDIGTVKIPKWLEKNGYRGLDLSWTSGGAFPENIEDFDLIIHCGACMLTRREVLRRIDFAMVNGVPIVNYGILIANLHGILERAVSPFIKELN